jgi:hypothetical protein
MRDRIIILVSRTLLNFLKRVLQSKLLYVFVFLFVKPVSLKIQVFICSFMGRKKRKVKLFGFRSFPDSVTQKTKSHIVNYRPKSQYNIKRERTALSLAH